MDPSAKACSHINQGVGAEQIDATSQEVADPRLGHPVELRRSALL
jgi:hypothetical protein